jgi:hypothetical protein
LQVGDDFLVARASIRVDGWRHFDSSRGTILIASDTRFFHRFAGLLARLFPEQR